MIFLRSWYNRMGQRYEKVRKGFKDQANLPSSHFLLTFTPNQNGFT
jgi:hypothetical protein